MPGEVFINSNESSFKNKKKKQIKVKYRVTIRGVALYTGQKNYFLFSYFQLKCMKYVFPWTQIMHKNYK